MKLVIMTDRPTDRQTDMKGHRKKEMKISKKMIFMSKNHMTLQQKDLYENPYLRVTSRLVEPPGQSEGT